VIPGGFLQHGIGGAKDLPLPPELAIAGAVAALAVSFGVLALAWRNPRYDGRPPDRPLGRPAPAWLSSRLGVSEEEVDNAIREQAANYNVPVEKMRKEFEENDRIDGLAEQILLGKTLDFLKQNVIVQPTPEPAASGASPEIKS